MSALPVTSVHASGSAVEQGVAPTPERSHTAYRVGSRPARVLALGATVLVHLAVGAVVAIGWQRHDASPGIPHLTSVIVLPQRADEPRQRPSSGTRAPDRMPESLPVASSLPPTFQLVDATPAVLQNVAELPAPADGGHEDALAIATQAYRRAIMARLEAQRRSVRSDRTGAGESRGAVLFRIERSGRLLDAVVEQSTGNRRQDRAALSIVRRAAPFPAIPDALPDELAITLPVEFLISTQGPELATR